MKQHASNRLILTAGLFCTVLLGACTVEEKPRCAAGLHPVVSVELYFGRTMPGGEVRDADWQKFLDSEVSSRFPHGFTVIDAQGQWQGQGSILRERTKKLVLIVTGTNEDRAKVAAIRIAYRTRFQQESVLMYETTGCGAF